MTNVVNASLACSSTPNRLKYSPVLFNKMVIFRGTLSVSYVITYNVTDS